MVELTLIYNGELRTTATHGPSGSEIQTDAPTDNHGLGQRFSPSDLLAAALGSCMLTYIGIAANKHAWNVEGTKLTVKKEMVADPLRRIGRLVVDVYLTSQFDDKDLRIITNSITTCPVKLSINDQIQVPITLHTPE
ncbi:MAG: OsmC family protein [Ignavibacteria bacterium]|nr:OsmC family protein [Ignavibacteria bacterium]